MPALNEVLQGLRTGLMPRSTIVILSHDDFQRLREAHHPDRIELPPNEFDSTTLYGVQVLYSNRVRVGEALITSADRALERIIPSADVEAHRTVTVYAAPEPPAITPMTMTLLTAIAKEVTKSVAMRPPPEESTLPPTEPLAKTLWERLEDD